MRPEGKGPLDSLYFDYPIFSAPPVAEFSKQGAHPVVIVGAGPVGLTAALTLAKFGIASVVVEKKNTFNDGSRAICIARPSFQILQQIGAIEPFLAKSLGWTKGRSYYRDKEIYRFEMPHPASEKYLPMYNLQQQYIEQYLWDACAREPLIDVRWESEVISLEQADGGVDLSVSSTAGDYNIRAQYLLAADGARSSIRSMLGLRLAGQNYEGQYVIADVRMAHDFPTERRAFFEAPGNPGGTVLIHKQPDNIWRIDYQLRDGETAAEAMQESEIRQRVGAILSGIGHEGAWELEWWSVYTANTLCLDDYRHGRILFIGDSAHIVPIFGVRGLNNGLADAFNAGWKLAYVLNGRASDALLDSYTPERRGATLDVFANATKSTRFMTPPTRGWKLTREAVLSLALSQPFARQFADPRQMQPYTYRDSPLTDVAGERGFTGGPSSGAAAPNARMGDGSHVLDHVGRGFVGLYFATSAEPATALARLQAIDPDFTLLIINPEATDGQEAASVYAAAPGTFYLLRPDTHIAARWREFDIQTVANCLARSLGKDAP